MSNRCTTHFHACDCREERFKELQDRLSEAEKVIEDLLAGNDRMFIQLNKQKRNLVYIHNSDEPSVTKDNLRAEALVIASNIGHELDGENFWNIRPSIKRARQYLQKWTNNKHTGTHAKEKEDGKRS